MFLFQLWGSPNWQVMFLVKKKILYGPTELSCLETENIISLNYFLMTSEDVGGQIWHGISFLSFQNMEGQK